MFGILCLLVGSCEVMYAGIDFLKIKWIIFYLVKFNLKKIKYMGGLNP